MEDNQDIYKVVINHEGQYSIWPAHREAPLGWNEVSVRGAKKYCLEHIKNVWTDMRPNSLRERMEARQRDGLID